MVFVYPTVGAIHESPVDFDVICPSVTPYGVPPPQQVGRFAERHLGRSLQFVGANCVRPPACHSEPLGEESRFVYFYFALLEILRFAQDDKKTKFILPIYKQVLILNSEVLNMLLPVIF